MAKIQRGDYPIFLSCCLLLFFHSSALLAQNLMSFPFLHEAYIPTIKDLVPFEAIPTLPPSQVKEKIPLKTDPLARWIAGDWAWVPSQNDFIWISGVWRRPPPHQFWMSGYWKQFPQGWVYVNGFWSSLPENSLTYLSVMPPDPLQENVPPAPGEDDFWDPGYWTYVPELENYIWLEGMWRQMDCEWMLVPAHYHSREQGIFFIPAFWDWPLEVRGQAYQPVNIVAEESEETSYEPMEALAPQAIVLQLLSRYPDYLYFYSHYVHFHPEVWSFFPFVPPWWQWQNWWTFNWNDQWGLWWWYIHPGSPQPSWIDERISRQLPPPSPAALTAGRRVIPPLIVTPLGVITSIELFKILFPEQTRNQRFPIVRQEFVRSPQWMNRLKQKLMYPSFILQPTGTVSEVSKKNDKWFPRKDFKRSID